MNALVGGGPRVAPGPAGAIAPVQDGGARREREPSRGDFAECLDAAAPPREGVTGRRDAPRGEPPHGGDRPRVVKDLRPAGGDDVSPESRAQPRERRGDPFEEGHRSESRPDVGVLGFALPVPPFGVAPVVGEVGTRVAMPVAQGGGLPVTTLAPGAPDAAEVPAELDLAGLTGRADVRVEVLEGVAEDASRVPRDLGPTSLAVDAHSRARVEVDASPGVTAVGPSTEDGAQDAAVRPDAAAPTDARLVDARLPVRAVAEAPLRAGVESLNAAVASQDAVTSPDAMPPEGAPSEGDGVSDALAEVDGGGAECSEPATGGAPLSGDARTVAGRALGDVRAPAPAAPATEDARQDGVLDAFERLPARIVVGVADRDGAWQMELRRGDAGLDVLLRGDHEFVGAVRGVEADLRHALVGSGERDARVRVDVGVSGGGAGAAGHDHEPGRRGAAPEGMLRGSSRAERAAIHPGETAAPPLERRPSRGLRLDRII